jgi:hypothetical protein
MFEHTPTLYLKLESAKIGQKDFGGELGFSPVSGRRQVTIVHEGAYL